MPRVSPSRSTRWPLSATTSPNCGPRGLAERIPHSRRYPLVGKGYSICVAFLKVFEKIYAPLTAGLRAPFRGDRDLPDEKPCALDRQYQRICDDLDALLPAVGLKVAA